MNENYVIEINKLKENLLILEQSIIKDKMESDKLVSSLYKEIEVLQLNESNEKIVIDDLKSTLQDLDIKYKEFIIFCENEKIKVLEEHGTNIEGMYVF
jgi:predicted RNase H-like nuclease (RuvC/YqgF family)